MFRGDNEEASKINRYLDGLDHNFLGQPIFRLVKADEQFELREGDYNEFHGSLFLRTIHGIKEVPKYPQLRGFYLLEQWFDASRVYLESIKEHNGYECIYTFRDKNFNALPLRLRVVELIIKAKQQYRKSSMLSKSLLQASLDKKEEQNFQLDMDVIDTSAVESSLHLGDGISMYVSKKGK